MPGRVDRVRAFTLIELLVVITIIGVLTSVVVIYVDDADDKAKAKRVGADFATLKTACSRFKLDHGRWPATLEDLVAGPRIHGVATRYLEDLPGDPWTHAPYAMEFEDDGRPYFVSLGADQSEGGDGWARDLRSNQRLGH